MAAWAWLIMAKEAFIFSEMANQNSLSFDRRLIQKKPLTFDLSKTISGDATIPTDAIKRKIKL